MLVRDFTPVYSPLGRWAGRRMNAYGDIDIAGIINSVTNAVDKTVGSVVKIVDAATPDQKAQVVNYQPYVQPSGQVNMGPTAGLPQKKWYEDPLTLGAVGLGVLGLGAVLLGRRRRRLAGFGGHSRRRRSRR